MQKKKIMFNLVRSLCIYCDIYTHVKIMKML